MNKSEKVTSALSQMYFYKELILDHLQFIDSNHQTQELADIIINLDDIIIAIQIKERDADSQTNEPTVEQKWFDNKIPKAKQQIKNTINFIRKEKLPLFKDTSGNEREIQPDAEIIPLVIFFNDVITEYPHLLKSTENGISVNCMSFNDFQKICSVLLTPGEIIDYLKYRSAFYEKNGRTAFLINDVSESDCTISRPSSNENLVYHYLFERYGSSKTDYETEDLKWIRRFIQESLNRSIAGRDNEGTYAILLFLAKLRRIEISLFRLELTRTWDHASKQNYGAVGSLRNNKTVVYFVAAQDGRALSMDVLLDHTLKKCNPKLLIQIYIWWETKTVFRIDYLLMKNDKEGMCLSEL